ncbi:hypothetical protein JNW88_26560 [Micromonospora sp. ATA32]|nr:hypothetical protein [Micromonospora sp. ATA32]
MATLVWLLVALGCVAVAAAAGWRWRARARPEPSREQRLAAAAKAARGIRRSAPRPHRDTFERGDDPTDRYSDAFLEV